MRKIIVGLVAIVFLCALTTVALAGGYKNYDSGDKYTTSPHGGYSTSTDKCRTCHAIHGATGEHKLLRSDNASATCDFCHKESGAHSNKIVYDVDSPTAEHTIGTTTIPDSDNGSGGEKTISGGLACGASGGSCHSVHGTTSKIIAGSKILKKDPAGDGGEVTSADPGFCADCHNKNYDDDVNGITHVMTTADGTYAFAGSEACGGITKCHRAADDYPHSSANYEFLKTGASSTALDTVCLDCHQSGGSGVGLTY